MTDVPDGSGPIRRSRMNDGGAPASGALAIVLALLAVVAGFFILRTITDGGDDAGGLDFGTENNGIAVDLGDSDDEATESSVVATTTSSTVPPIVTAGATVVVANANGLGGSAGAMSDALELGPGYDMADPTNASSATPDLEETIIYYDTTVPAAQVVAESLGRSLGGVSTIEPLPENIPTSDGTMGDAQVLLMLGLDKANQTLEELNPTAVAEVESPAPDATETTAPADG